jgi:hypothetical protein
MEGGVFVGEATIADLRSFLGIAWLCVLGGGSMEQTTSADCEDVPDFRPAPTNEACSWAYSSTVYGMMNGMTRRPLAADLCARIADNHASNQAIQRLNSAR